MPEGPERDTWRAELAEKDAELVELEGRIKELLLPHDPNEGRNVIIEIQGTEGGEEANLWAGDLYRMYQQFAERHGLKIEVLSSQPSEHGGYRDITFMVKGPEAWSLLKYEGGPHRVQRVPSTESQGRIHTSAATVAVLPEAEDIDVEVDPNDLVIEVFRATGPGGQSVNTTDSAVRIKHEPTGLVVSCQDEKSQLQNKDKAMRILRSRLLQAEQDRQHAEVSAARRDQVKGAAGPRRSGRTITRRTGSPITASRSRSTRSTACSTASSTRWSPRLRPTSVPASSAASDRDAIGGRSGARLRRVLSRTRASDRPRPRHASSSSACRATRRVNGSRSPTAGRPSAPNARCATWCARRVAGEPLQYVLGGWGFRGLDLFVDRRVLIPRPETEYVVEVALEEAARSGLRRSRRRLSLVETGAPSAVGRPRDGLGRDRDRARRRVARRRGLGHRRE